MKVMYTIHNMNQLEKQHLQANIDYSMCDIALEARRSLERLESSRMLNSKLLPPDLAGMVESMKGRQEVLLQDVSTMFYLKWHDSLVKTDAVIELFVSPVYFSFGEALQTKFGRLGKRLIKTVDQQTLLDKIGEDFRKVYNKKYEAEVLESDGKKLVA